MILYHGTNTEIEFVDLEKCRPFKDLVKVSIPQKFTNRLRKWLPEYLEFTADLLL